MNSTNQTGQEAIELLKEIVDWWDKWNNTDNPSELENPPIEEARQLIAEIKNAS